MSSEDVKIFEVDYGLSSRYDEGIEINRKLTGSLRQKILNHELRHSKGKYTKKDFINDFHSHDPYFWESVRFCLKNPEAMINYFFLMFSYHFKAFTFNITALIPFFLWGLIFSWMSMLVIKTSFILGFLTWTWVYALINIAYLVYTHIYVMKCRRIDREIALDRANART